MSQVVTLSIAFVAVEHVYILWLEMFVWMTQRRRTFKSFPPHLFEPTKSLAVNWGLYNGFLAAGLIWLLLLEDETWHTNIAVFFLGCVSVAGLFGAPTLQKSIVYIQALLALAFLFS